MIRELSKKEKNYIISTIKDMSSMIFNTETHHYTKEEFLRDISDIMSECLGSSNEVVEMMEKDFGDDGKKVALNIKINEELFDMGDDYCKHCKSCGIEGCCSPTMCDMKPGGLHCESNLEQLKFGYWMSEELGKRNPELYHEIFDVIKKDLEDEG